MVVHTDSQYTSIEHYEVDRKLFDGLTHQYKETETHIDVFQAGWMRQ